MRPFHSTKKILPPILVVLLIVAMVSSLDFPSKASTSGSSSDSDTSVTLSTEFVPTPTEAPTISVPVVEETVEPVPEVEEESPVEVCPTPDPLPPVSDAPWYLTLTNKDHSVPEDWEVHLKDLPNGLPIDSRIYADLMAMLADCKAAGLSPIVCSAYRTIDRQTELFQAKINTFLRKGLSYDEAYAAASNIVAIPGTSEHNLGLAVDICAASYQFLNSKQAQTAEQQWLMEHCAEYGFILRYPEDKQEITGIIWEPWHYRYVGRELAREITDSGLCLEEYLALYYDLS